MVTRMSAGHTGLEKGFTVLGIDGDHRSLVKFETEYDCERILFRIKQFLKGGGKYYDVGA